MTSKIHILRALKDNFIYAIENGGRCAVIDPGESGPVRNFLAQTQLQLTHVLLTHHHPDHVDGTPDLITDGNVQVWCSDYDRNRLPFATQTAGEQTTELWDESLQVLLLPGHTLGQIGYYFSERNALFCGDTLFSAGCGRLFEGTPAMMHSSLEKIRLLPATTQVYFGHEYTLRNLEFVQQSQAANQGVVRTYRDACLAKLAAGNPTTPTTVGQELQINPFLRAQSVEDFTKWRELRNHF